MIEPGDVFELPGVSVSNRIGVFTAFVCAVSFFINQVVYPLVDRLQSSNDVSTSPINSELEQLNLFIKNFSDTMNHRASPSKVAFATHPALSRLDNFEIDINRLKQDSEDFRKLYEIIEQRFSIVNKNIEKIERALQEIVPKIKEIINLEFEIVDLRFKLNEEYDKFNKIGSGP